MSYTRAQRLPTPLARPATPLPTAALSLKVTCSQDVPFQVPSETPIAIVGVGWIESMMAVTVPAATVWNGLVAPPLTVSVPVNGGSVISVGVGSIGVIVFAVAAASGAQKGH